MRDYAYENIVKFIDEHYIDTEYYLNEEARELIEEGVLHLKNIDKMPADEMVHWLDLEKLVQEECI